MLSNFYLNVLPKQKSVNTLCQGGPSLALTVQYITLLVVSGKGTMAHLYFDGGGAHLRGMMGKNMCLVCHPESEVPPNTF